MKFLVALSTLLTATATACAEDIEEDDLEQSRKWRFNLLNPTPRSQMRELSTDRPDQTESAYTVDAGHFQVEMDVAAVSLDEEGSGRRRLRTSQVSAAALNLKCGVFNNVDVQLMLDSYIDIRIKDGANGTSSHASGFGDVSTRLKVNVWGNDGGKTALAMMPFVKWPLPESSLRNGRTEGGIIFPLAINLAEGWGLGCMTEFDFVAGERSAYDTDFVNSITLGHDLTGKLGMYLEFYTVAPTASGASWQGQADIGWTYGVTENVQWDFGCNFGVTRSAPDFGPFMGVGVRF